ncbi:hypothetical protein D3C78_954640 [compost metagenome]
MIFDNRYAITIANIEKRQFALPAPHCAGWIAIVRRYVRERRLQRADHLLQVIRQHPVPVTGHRDDNGAALAQQRQRLRRRWCLHQHRVAQLHSGPQQQAQRLFGAAHEQQAFRADPSLSCGPIGLGEPFSQRQISFSRCIPVLPGFTLQPGQPIQQLLYFFTFKLIPAIPIFCCKRNDLLRTFHLPAPYPHPVTPNAILMITKIVSQDKLLLQFPNRTLSFRKIYRFLPYFEARDRM